MTERERCALYDKAPVLREMADGREVVWINPERARADGVRQELSMRDIDEAALRLGRFAPFVARCFPETAARGGLIESELAEIAGMKRLINEKYHAGLEGRLLLKMDSHLPIAGSVKARGGIYEVLKHTEELALSHGLLCPEDARGEGNPEKYLALASPAARAVFAGYSVQVGSTGNLGMSIGIMSAAVGYSVTVHMSADAKQWKKELLRSHGVQVIEYASDYSEAVKQGRRLSEADPKSYFVDDENSRTLFLGYAVAAKRLEAQLRALAVAVDETHPLFVYIPCGVGGAPGGICFGLRQVFGDNVHCFFVEPTQAPCMLAGMASGLQSRISVQDIWLSGQTEADGLAVGRASGFVGEMMRPHMSGEFTVCDARLYDYLRDMLATEGIFLEPSACAAFQGPVMLGGSAAAQAYIRDHGLAEKMRNAAHIVWATGGRLVPEDIRAAYRETYL